MVDLYSPFVPYLLTAGKNAAVFRTSIGVARGPAGPVLAGPLFGAGNFLFAELAIERTQEVEEPRTLGLGPAPLRKSRHRVWYPISREHNVIFHFERRLRFSTFYPRLSFSGKSMAQAGYKEKLQEV